MRRARTHFWAAEEREAVGGMEQIHLEEARALLEEARGLRFTARRVHLAHRVTSLIRNTSESSSDLLTEEYDELKRNYREIQEENLKLQAIITDVTEVNKRWQRYNNDRQVYVDKLLTTIREQQEQMNKISKDSAVNLTKQNSSGSESENLRQKNFELREEVHHLRKELDEREREGAALRVQAQVHRDDWEAERAEKIAALQQREQAEKLVEELKIDLRNLSQKLREERLRGPFQCPNCGHCLPLEDTALAPKPVEPCKGKGSLIARGCCMTSDDDMYLTCDKVSSNKPLLSGAAKDSNTGGPGIKEKSCETTVMPDKNNFTEDSPCTSFSVVSGEGAVTLGFSSSGLASVTSFPVHTYSPVAATATSRKSTPSRSDSPPSAQQDSRRSSMSCTPVWTQPKEEDDGIATQTRMDIICPGCSAVFPPRHHIDFLDHFELCQQQKPSKQEQEEPKNVLKCPKCSRTFPSSQQVNFLDHFDQCQWPERRFVGQSTANNDSMSR